MKKTYDKNTKSNYEKTCMLLDRYTSAMWYVSQANRLLQREYLSDIGADNEVVNVEAAGMSDMQVQKKFASTLKYHKDIIRYINFAISCLKEAPNGETLYVIIDVLYLQKETKGLPAVEQLPEITSRIEKYRTKKLSPRVYQRLKKEALDIISFILFDTTVELKDCIEELLKVS